MIMMCKAIAIALVLALALIIRLCLVCRQLYRLVDEATAQPRREPITAEVCTDKLVRAMQRH